MVAMGIFVILSGGTAWLYITSSRSNAIIWEQLEKQNEGRKVLQEVIDTVRRAEQSSIGAYPIERADLYELILYANVDTDTLRERVRFFVDVESNTFVRGVIKPAGNPLVYSGANESTSTLASDVVNDDEGVPVFLYYNEQYTGTQTALTPPVSTTDIHVIRVQLELEKDPTATPVPLHVESVVHVRNLKTN